MCPVYHGNSKIDANNLPPLLTHFPSDDGVVFVWAAVLDLVGGVQADLGLHAGCPPSPARHQGQERQDHRGEGGSRQTLDQNAGKAKLQDRRRFSQHPGRVGYGDSTEEAGIKVAIRNTVNI